MNHILRKYRHEFFPPKSSIVKIENFKFDHDLNKYLKTIRRYRKVPHRGWSIKFLHRSRDDRSRARIVVGECFKWPWGLAAQARVSSQVLLIISRELCTHRRCLLHRTRVYVEARGDERKRKCIYQPRWGWIGGTWLHRNIEFHGAVSRCIADQRNRSLRPLPSSSTSSTSIKCVVYIAHSCVFQRIGCDAQVPPSFSLSWQTR